MLLAAVYKSPQKLWSDTDIAKLLGFRNKSILADNLNAKHPVWNSEVSNPSCLKLLELFVVLTSKFQLHNGIHTTHLMVEVMFSTFVYIRRSNCKRSLLLTSVYSHATHIKVTTWFCVTIQNTPAKRWTCHVNGISACGQNDFLTTK
jgi:hypothetical protein